MEIFYGLLTAYLVVGVVLNFVGPLSRKIWVEKMKVASNNENSKIKLLVFECVIRMGVILFFPIFLI